MSRQRRRPFAALIDTKLLGDAARLSVSAKLLRVELFAHSAANGTNGTVTRDDITSAASIAKPWRAAVPALIESGRLVEVGPGMWKLTEWDDTQASTKQLEEKAKAKRDQYKPRAKRSKPAAPQSSDSEPKTVVPLLTPGEAVDKHTAGELTQKQARAAILDYEDHRADELAQAWAALQFTGKRDGLEVRLTKAAYQLYKNRGEDEPMPMLLHHARRLALELTDQPPWAEAIEPEAGWPIRMVVNESRDIPEEFGQTSADAVRWAEEQRDATIRQELCSEIALSGLPGWDRSKIPADEQRPIPALS
ncbi:hypothetical protein [Nocardia sp. NBC_01329]|uniref:hypothetical protein n=1 Tax=Nocardia sp. NBC_01329 TaxID=2903594 RepID=UPI002E11E31D|nr:hypothetical protein OG405_02790 [Nocardia sp. NBC_01329]